MHWCEGLEGARGSGEVMRDSASASGDDERTRDAVGQCRCCSLTSNLCRWYSHTACQRIQTLRYILGQVVGIECVLHRCGKAGEPGAAVALLQGEADVTRKEWIA